VSGGPLGDAHTHTHTDTHTHTHAVFLCVCRCTHPPPEGKPLNICPAYWKLKESITQYELYLLRVLRFDIKVDLPHPVGEDLQSNSYRVGG